MTIDELKAEIVKKKLAAFDAVVSFTDVDPKHTGHQSKEHRALDLVLRAKKDIEKIVLKWERDNPDK